MITFTKEQLIASAHARIEFAEMMLAGELEPLKERTWSIELELARIALASLEAEVVAYIRSAHNPDGFCFADGIHPTHRHQRLPLSTLQDGCYWKVTPLYTAPPAPANAEPVAWLWSHRKHPSEVSLVRPEDDERAEGAHWSGWSCQSLFAAPPAPASVPDDVSGPLAHAYKELTPTFMRNHIDVFERYGIYPDGSAGIQAMRIALDGMNRRAAMLQGADGNSPLIPDGLRLALSNAGIAAPESDEMLAATCEKYIQALVDWVKDRKPFEPAKVVPDGWVMVPVEPTMSQEIAGYRTLTDTGKMSRLMKTRLSNIYRAMLAAAPQQEVK